MLDAFTVRDSAAEAFMRPFFAQSQGAAIRSFSDMVNGEAEHPIAAHPEDYTLFALGTFNERTGMMETHEPRSLGNGATFVLVPSTYAPLLEEPADA